MTKASHTPGPWVLSDEWEGILVHAPQSCKFVCEVTETNPVYTNPESGISNAEALANARLIAAAPEMLVALEAAEKEIRGWSWTGNARDKGPYDDHLASIRAAIAKAKGT